MTQTEQNLPHRLKQELYDLMKENSDIFEFLQSGSLDGIWYYDLESDEDEWMSPRFWEVLGFDPQEKLHVASEWMNLIHPEDLKVARTNLNKHLADPTHPYDQIVRYRHKDGSTVWVRCRGIAIRNEDGKPIRLLGAHTDLTPFKRVEEELRRAHEDLELRIGERTAQLQAANLQLKAEIFERMKVEEALRVKEDRYSRATTIGRVGVWELDATTGFYHGDENLKTLFGYESNELSSDPYVWLDLVHPEDKSIALSLWGAIIAGKSDSYCHELRMIKKDGTVMWTDVRGQAIRDTTGQLTHLFGTTVDITDRKRIEEELKDKNFDMTRLLLEHEQVEKALRVSTDQYHSLIEAIPQQVWTARPDGTLDYVNQRVLDYFNSQPDDLLGWEWQSVLHPDGLPRCIATWQNALTTGEPYEIQFRLRRARDGEYRWHLARALPVKDKNNRIVKWFGTNTDITESKQMEEALRISEAQLHRFIAEAPIGLVLYGRDRRVLRANKTFCKLTGFEEHELRGHTYARFTHSADLNANINLTDQFYNGERDHYTYEKRYIRKSGEIIWVSVNATRVELPDHETPLQLVAVQDITEQKCSREAREQLSQDLHDHLLQSLYAVGMHLETSKRVMEKSPRESKEYLTQAIGQLNHQVHEIQQFIRSLKHQDASDANLGQALRQLIASFSATGHPTPNLEIEDAAVSLVPSAQAGHLLNIVREALSNSLRHAHATHQWVQFSHRGDSLRLVICDDGVGFSPKTHTHRGHGLANMAARAKKMHTKFIVDSTPGKGTRVIVDIPLEKGNGHR